MLGIEPSPTPLEPKLWRMHFDNLMNTGQLNPDILPHMDSYQHFAVNEVKKFIARTKSRTQEFIPEDKYTT